MFQRFFIQIICFWVVLVVIFLNCLCDNCNGIFNEFSIHSSTHLWHIKNDKGKKKECLVSSPRKFKHCCHCWRCNLASLTGTSVCKLFISSFTNIDCGEGEALLRTLLTFLRKNANAGQDHSTSDEICFPESFWHSPINSNQTVLLFWVHVILRSPRI